MKKSELKVGSRVKFRGPVGYVRVDDNLIQRANPGCNGVRSNAYHGTIKPSDSVFVVTGIAGREFEIQTEDKSEIRSGLNTITMRWCHQLDWAPAPVAKPTIESVSLNTEDNDSIDNLLEELYSLKEQMTQLSTIKVRYNQIQDRIVRTLNAKLSETKINVAKQLN